MSDPPELATVAAGGVAHLVEVASERGTDNVTAVLIDVDAWAAGVTPPRAPRRWPVRRRVQGGKWEVWIPNLTGRATGRTRVEADTALACALIEWAATDPGGPFADLAASLAEREGDLTAALALLS